jgi:hypothetical protein
VLWVEGWGNVAGRRLLVRDWIGVWKSASILPFFFFLFGLLLCEFWIRDAVLGDMQPDEMHVLHYIYGLSYGRIACSACLNGIRISGPSQPSTPGPRMHDAFVMS